MNSVFSPILPAVISASIFLPWIFHARKQIKSQKKANRKLTQQLEEMRGLQTAIFSILEDAQKARREAEESKHAVHRLAAIVESSTDAILGLTLEGIITSWNKGAEELYGWSEKEVMNKSLNLIIPSSLADEFSWIMNQIRSGKRIEHLETTRKKKNGALIQVSVSISLVRNDAGELVGASSIARDITQQKREQEKFRTAVEAAPNGMIMVDAAGKIVLVNSYAEKLFGYSSEELIHQPVEVLVPERFRVKYETYRGAYFGDMQKQLLESQEDFYCLRKNGEEFPAEISFNPMVTSEGAFVLSAIVDITKRKNAEITLRKAMRDLKGFNWELKKSSEALERANEKLQELDQAKSDFIMMASHELKTPLSAIKGYIILLLQDKVGNLNERQREYLTHVRHATERLSRLVIELLNLSKIETGQMSFNQEDVDLGEVLKEEVFTFKAEADRKKITLELALGNELKTVACDRDKIEEIMDNLISNALKFTPQQGTIRVAAKRNDGQVEISVEDTGIGIPRNDLRKIFEPFQHIRKAGLEGEESVGLGLALVKKLIEMHQGEINVESEENKGSKFTVFLPSGS